jgi:integrase/recombinase XerD
LVEHVIKITNNIIILHVQEDLMALGKQAKVLSDNQQKAVMAFISTNRLAQRNTVMFLLSVDAGLRAKEIASLEWSMITNADGSLADVIRLQDRAAKGSSGGIVYMSKRLIDAINVYAPSQWKSGTIIKSQNGKAMSAQVVTNWFFILYDKLGFDGCSSHSGRRTAITRWARKISSVGGSLRDVQALARHSSLQMTQRYIEVSEDACRLVVG